MPCESNLHVLFDILLMSIINKSCKHFTFPRIMWNVTRLVRPALQNIIMIFKIDIVVVVVYLTLADPLRIQPWSQDRRNQTRSEKKAGKADRRKRTQRVASKGHRRRYFQRAHFIPIVGLGKRGAY